MHIPASTYRVQLHQDFSLTDLREVVDYLHDLGITTIYAAPIVKAAPGSMHGYDITDPHRINPEVGDRKILEELSNMLRDRDMKWLQDIVPNHMAFSTSNHRLMDVLERGPDSPYYHYFDINWNHQDPRLKEKLMVPFLGKEFDECVDANEITITISDQGIGLTYFDSTYPVASATYDLLSDQCSEPVLCDALNEISSSSKIYRDLRLWQSARKKLFSLIQTSPEIHRVLEHLNRNKDQLRELAEQQYYRLTFWKHTERVINYRRFFTVNSLICLRMEDETVFNEYHELIATLYNQGIIHGVRVDHIDGLNNPVQYLRNLRGLLGEECYIVAEKILEANEEIPERWPIQGTSGYEFLSYVNKLTTDRRGAQKLVSFYETLMPVLQPYEEIVHSNKKLILEQHMAGELDNIVEYFYKLKLGEHLDRPRVKDSLALLMLFLPVYRVYPDAVPFSGTDKALMEEAFVRAMTENSAYHEELNYLRMLCITGGTDIPDQAILQFYRRLMQFTGPLTAKGVEDTTFYVYNPLISHDEVGDAPEMLGFSVKEFHQRMIKRHQATPLALNATATHDTKRGEDARIRLNALSEIPDEWILRVREWMKVNMYAKITVDGSKLPSTNDEYFIYQSMVGGFPEEMHVDESWAGRLKEYIVKAVREAKVMSNWESPNTDYENACVHFIETVLQGESPFLDTFVPFMRRVTSISFNASVVQSVVKMTAPGIPDIYQGTELWDLSYVDPDNRRPVDYAKRRLLLAELKAAESWEATREMLNRYRHEGIEKLFVTWKILQFRREKSDLFSHGVYLPFTTEADILAFARLFENDWCVVCTQLNFTKDEAQHSNIEGKRISLPDNSPLHWRNILTGEAVGNVEGQLSLTAVLKDFPVAVLVNLP